MDKQPLIFRTVIAVMVIMVFALSIYPLQPLDFYETLRKKANKVDAKLEAVIAQAKESQVKDPNLFAPTALLEAAGKQRVKLTDYVAINKTWDNSDVVNYIREQAASSIRLGIDLNGGAEFIVRLVPEKKSPEELAEEAGKPVKAMSMGESRDKAIEILRKRLEKENIFESELSPIGKDLISLKLPLVSRDEKENMLRLIERSAKLNFHLVHPENDRYVAQYRAAPDSFRPPVGYVMKESIFKKPGEEPETRHYLIRKNANMVVNDVRYAAPTLDQFGQREIILRLGPKGTKDFGKVTRENVGREMAIVLDGKVESAPVIREPILGGEAVISGNFSMDEAQSLSTTLVSGSLPVTLGVVGAFDTSPTLGAANVRYGTIASILSVVGVALFMLVYYMRAGIMANLAMVANVVLVLGAMATFSATLTLPGIAGIILTIGMSVDANVLINERIREELDANKTLASAIENGYDRAFSAILDSNLTTLLVALILWWLGSGAVKGFAVTLAIGIPTSMFTAIFLTRLGFDYMQRFWPTRTIRMMRLMVRPDIDFLGIGRYAVAGSVALIVLLLGFAAYRGERILSIDFTGGTQVVFNCQERVPENDVRAKLTEAGFPPARVIYKTNLLENKRRQLEVTLRERDVTNRDDANATIGQRMEKILVAAFPAAGITDGKQDSLGGLVGWEFSKNALLALFLSFLGIIVYVTIRFEFAYAIAGVVALVHDSIIAVGLYLLMGGEVTLNVIAAVLTIIGFSINDTIVIFDRIREDLTLYKNRPYKEIVNLGVNQTLSRTVLTTGTVLLVVAVLCVAGGTAINDFSMVMLFGCIAGTYSTVFIATPIVVAWHRRFGTKTTAEPQT